jgi:hypothetical protein
MFSLAFHTFCENSLVEIHYNTFSQQGNVDFCQSVAKKEKNLNKIFIKLEIKCKIGPCFEKNVHNRKIHSSQ